MSLFFLDQQTPVEKVDCLEVNLGDSNLIVPMSAVAEMVHHQVPQKVEVGPSWMLGWIEWRDIKLPLLDFSAIRRGEQARQIDENHKILILNSFAGDHHYKYYAVVTDGFPRAMRIQEDSELKAQEHAEGDECVEMVVNFEQESFLLPDFEKLETYLQQLPKPVFTDVSQV